MIIVLLHQLIATANGSLQLTSNQLLPPSTESAATATTSATTTTEIPNDENGFPTDDGSWAESLMNRLQVATYLFNELNHKNFSISDSIVSGSGPGDLFDEMGQTPSSAIHNNPLIYGMGGGGAGHAGDTQASVLFSDAQGGSMHGGSQLHSVHNSTGLLASTGHQQSPLGGLLNQAGGAGSVGQTLVTSTPRPYAGDALQSFQTIYWPIHCVICLVICTLGIFANLINIVVLTRPNMITAVNTILSAIAFSDLLVNISTIPYLVHELSDSTNQPAFHSFPWAVYTLVHAHTSVTAHTISIWLTCVLATWRYFVVCRSQSSNQRNWSVGLAKRTIAAVFLFVPCFCIPNYLSFAIIKDATETNSTIYRVGFSSLADESQFIKTFHFWIFSCLTKLLPCVLLTFFTTFLIRKLLHARERRLRLTSYGNAKRQSKDEEHNNNNSTNSNNNLINGSLALETSKNNCNNLAGKPGAARSKAASSGGADGSAGSSTSRGVLINGVDMRLQGNKLMVFNKLESGPSKQADLTCHPEGANKNTQANKQAVVLAMDNIQAIEAANNLSGDGNGVAETKQHQHLHNKQQQLAQLDGSSCAITEAEILFASRDGSCLSNGPLADEAQSQHQPQPRILSQLIVESTTSATNNTITISTSTAPTKMLASCDNQSGAGSTGASGGAPQQQAALEQAPRSASTCGALECYGDNSDHCGPDNLDNCCCSNYHHNQTLAKPLILSDMTASQELPQRRNNNQDRDVNSANDSPGNNNNSKEAKLDRKSFAASAGANNDLLNEPTKPTNCVHQSMFMKFHAEKRSSENIFNGTANSGPGSGGQGSAHESNQRARSSTTLGPFQMIKFQAAQKQLTQNETTTRLLIAVMLVFLICEFPAGILAALCAILGQDFWENVYQPCGTVTDLLALINSSVNFILYCFMSTQFRITFYRVVLHCPAPNVSQQQETRHHTINHNNLINQNNNSTNHNHQHTIAMSNVVKQGSRNANR